MEEFRKTAPNPLEDIPFNLPQPFETELPNGLKIVVVKDRRHPILNFRLAFRTGDLNDPEDCVGLTSTMVSLLNEGTEKHTSKELAEEVGRLGASLSASAGFDNTVVRASALSIYKEEIIDLLAELVLTPTFPENELELYKQNAIEGLKFQRSQPDFLADEQVAKIVYGSHPYGINSPSVEDIEKIKREQIVDLYSKSFIPNNATLFVIGDVESEWLVSKIEEKFGGWEKGEIDNPTFPDFPERTERTLTIVDRKGSTQSNIVLSNLALKRNHPDFFNVLVMNQILGAGASSRLFMNLREEKGYTYGAYSRIYSKRLAGSFEATSEVRTAVTEDSLKEFFFEINKIREEKVSEEELIDAKNYLTGVFPIKAETQNGLTGLIVSQKLYDLPDDYLETYRDNVNKVTAEDVQTVANKYISPDKIALVIVGDAEDVLPQAKSYAEKIEIFDTEGNPQELSKYAEDSNAETANVAGNWKLSVEAMGQAFELNLMLKQDGENLSGKIESMLGESEIGEAKIIGNSVSASAKSEFSGQDVELNIKGTVDGDSIEGTINAAIIPAPFEFKGKRV